MHLPLRRLLAPMLTAALFTASPALADQCGKASWYKMGSVTANGEAMDPGLMTAAHRSLPFGTRVLVENLANDRSVVLRINDRGPFIKGRIIDVTEGAAERLDMIGSGVAAVRVTVLNDPGADTPGRTCAS